TEDDNGHIWAVTYPNSGVVCFDPKEKKIADFGYVHQENWAQYQRFVATDRNGWLYFAIGNTASQVVAFHPGTGQSHALLEPKERKRGLAYLYPGTDGKVYGKALHGSNEPWFMLYDGKKVYLGDDQPAEEKLIRTGSQTLKLFHFPDGQKVVKLD